MKKQCGVEYPSRYSLKTEKTKRVVPVKYNIHVVPVRYNFGEKGYIDKVSQTSKEFYLELPGVNLITRIY